MDEDKKDVEELKEVLEVVSEKVPKLLNEITDALFSPKKAEEFGASVAKFYKTLKEAGMDDQQAFELTQKYMSSFSMGGIIGQAIGGFGPNVDFDHKHKDGEHKFEVCVSDKTDLGARIEAKVKKKLQDKGIEPKDD